MSTYFIILQDAAICGRHRWYHDRSRRSELSLSLSLCSSIDVALRRRVDRERGASRLQSDRRLLDARRRILYVAGLSVAVNEITLAEISVGNERGKASGEKPKSRSGYS